MRSLYSNNVMNSTTNRVGFQARPLKEGKAFLLLLVLCIPSQGQCSMMLNIDFSQLAAEVDPRFLSVALDSHIVAESWKNFDFQSERVLHMAKALSPAFLRLGGTAADLMYFSQRDKGIISSLGEPRPCQTSASHCYCTNDKNEQKRVVGEDLENWLYKNRTAFPISGLDWIKVNEFSRKAGWSFLFDVNVLLRNKRNKWSKTNARRLMKFSMDQGFEDITWELGNEPNSLMHQLGRKIPARTLGQDFKRLRRLLDTFPMYQNSSLVGPDVNQLRAEAPSKRKAQKALRYLRNVYQGSVLKKSQESILDALTWHHYYLNGHTATLQDFLDVDHLNNLPQMFDTVQRFLSKHGINRPLWLGETSSAYGGGAHGLSDRYVATFLWLDKLGQSALHNYKVIIRQTFYHGCYALIGEDLLPNPDFWISAAYKRLVSAKVLSVSASLPKTGKLRMYAHCGRINGSLVVFGINMENSTRKMELENLPSCKRLCSFHFTPSSNDSQGLRNREIRLNGKVLRLNPENGSVPDLMQFASCQKCTTKTLQELQAPPFSNNFYVFEGIPQDRLKVCL